MPSITLTRQDTVAIIRLTHPERGNSVTMDMATELAAIAQEVAEDNSIRAVLLASSGTMFCVGGDISGFAAHADNPTPFLHKLADTLHLGMKRLLAMPKPFVVAVNGAAAGAGMSLALSGDAVIAGRAASFTAAYSAVGLTPDGGMSWLLPRLVGLRMAQQMILTNRRVKAEEALALGMVTEVVDDDALEARALAVAQSFANAAIGAISKARSLMMDGAINSFAAHLDLEAREIAAASASAESREGVAAFLARRPADFAGQ